MCHTPSYYLFSKNHSLGAPVKQFALTGAMVEGFYAPNITSTNLRNTPIKQIADVFLKDRLIGGGQVQGPMLDANHDSLKYLTQNDIIAIATYLKSVKSQTPPKPSHGGSGKDTYETYCAGCHASGAGGAPKFGDSNAWDPLIKQGLNTLYKNAINGIGAMPAKGTCATCSDQAIQAAVQYMVNQSKPGSGNATSAPANQAPKQLTLADGKKIYERYCAACHNPDSNYANAPKIGDQQAWAPRIKQGFDVLFRYTIEGHGNMSPRGACPRCSDAQLKAALLYMVEQSKTQGDYRLW